MKVQTHSPRAVDARKTLVELLLANHPDDCLYCARNGELRAAGRWPQQLGVRRRRYFGGRTPARMDVSSPSIVRDPAKCILCGKCVRVCEEIQAVGGDRLHRPRQPRPRRPGVRRGPERQQLRQLRAVRGGVPDRAR